MGIDLHRKATEIAEEGVILYLALSSRQIDLNVANICYNRTAGDAEKRLGARPFEGVAPTFANRTGLHLW
jgi:hypothetical protein